MITYIVDQERFCKIQKIIKRHNHDLAKLYIVCVYMQKIYTCCLHMLYAYRIMYIKYAHIYTQSMDIMYVVCVYYIVSAHHICIESTNV